MKKYNEDDVNYSKTFSNKAGFRQGGKLCDDIGDHLIEGKTLYQHIIQSPQFVTKYH